MTIRGLIEFVKQHRTNGICEGWSDYEITYSIDKAIKEHCCCYSVTDKNEIDGVAWGHKREGNQFYIQTLIAKSKDALHKMVTFFKVNFNGYTIVADRGDRFIIYTNTTRLLNKLTK